MGEIWVSTARDRRKIPDRQSGYGYSMLALGTGLKAPSTCCACCCRRIVAATEILATLSRVWYGGLVTYCVVGGARLFGSHLGSYVILSPACILLVASPQF